jgi:hypothetical protein
MDESCVKFVSNKTLFLKNLNFYKFIPPTEFKNTNYETKWSHEKSTHFNKVNLATTNYVTFENFTTFK